MAAGGGKPNYAVDVYVLRARERSLAHGSPSLPGVILLKDVRIKALVGGILIQGFNGDLPV